MSIPSKPSSRLTCSTGFDFTLPTEVPVLVVLPVRTTTTTITAAPVYVMPEVAVSNTVVHTCAVCDPPARTIGELARRDHLNGKRHAKSLRLGPLNRRLGPLDPIWDDVCKREFPYRTEYQVHVVSNNHHHTDMSAWYLGHVDLFCIKCFKCVRSTELDHIAGKRHSANMVGSPPNHPDGYPWVRLCSGRNVPLNAVGRNQLATSERLRARFPPQSGDGCREPTLSDEDMIEELE
jgi:hypothetical protein